MEVDIVYAVAMILEQVGQFDFKLMSEPVKMVMEECLSQAILVNMDNTHPYIMTCTAFTETGVGV